MILVYAKKIKINKALSSDGMIYIKNEEDYEEVGKAFQRLIDNDKDFEVYVPMKFMFLRCLLGSTKKLFMTREELVTYGASCAWCRKW